MVWLFVALVGWMVIASPVALLVGAAARTAERRERSCRRPLRVHDGWALTPLR
ncbi:MAG: hypothetical protein JWR28_2306 [Modestobacter sp.]|nr:hypothetical protein [Modestobacter sp.]